MELLTFYISNIDPRLLNSISGRPRELIDLIRLGKFTDEKKIAAELYKRKQAYANYLNLKCRAKRVLEAFYLMNPPIKGSPTLQKMQECRKLYHLGMHLSERHKDKEGQKMFEQAYKIAEEYNFTELACNCVGQLMVDAALNGNSKVFERYATKEEALQADLKAECFARKYYYKIIQHTNVKRGVMEDLFTKVIKELDKIPCTTIKFQEHYFAICILQSTNKIDYGAIKQNAEDALTILEEEKGVPYSVLQFFCKHKAIAHIALKEHPEAQQLLSKAEQYAPVRSFNRGIIYLYQAVNALHSGNYKEAYTLYRKHRHVKHENLSDQWMVMGAYLYFLRHMKQFDVGTDRFPISKYLNETQGTVHDKRGNKINVIVGELLALLLQDRDRFIDRAAIAAKYPHLKGKELRRVKWFLSILCAIPRANFNWVALKRIARRAFKNLEETPLHLDCSLSVEVVPFEALLEMIRLLLEQPSREGRREEVAVVAA